jgi:hypothetical protein
MFKPLANPESLNIIGGFSYLPTKFDWFGDTVMLAPESQMTSNGDPLGISLLYWMGACNLAMPFVEWLDLLESLTQSTAYSHVPQSFG